MPFLFGDDLQYPVAVRLPYHLTTGQTVGDFTNAGQQRIRARYGGDAPLVVVEIVIDNRGVRLLTLGNMREQARTAEQVDYRHVIGVALQNLAECLNELSFLPHKRQGCLLINCVCHFCYPEFYYYLCIANHL